MSEEIVRARAVVRGRVQMVGFREFARRHARAAGLHGIVRNAPDGSLECVIEGPGPDVARVIEQLHAGPSHARVDRVDVEYEPAVGGLPPITVTA